MFGSARTAVSDPLYAQATDLAARMAQREVARGHRRRPGHHGCRGRRRRHRHVARRRDPSPFRDDLASPARRRGPPRRDEVLLHPKADVDEGVGRLRRACRAASGRWTSASSCSLCCRRARRSRRPIVLLDLPGDPYWEALERFLKGEVTRRGLVDREDGALYRITDDVGVAVDEILGFYRNYHSRRFVGSTMVIRCRFAPTDEELAAAQRSSSPTSAPRRGSGGPARFPPSGRAATTSS